MFDPEVRTGPAAPPRPHGAPLEGPARPAGRDLVPRAVRAGLVGGVAVLYLAAVGMVAQFNGRNLIHDVVTLGKLFMALPAFLAGYLAVRPRVRRGAVDRPEGRGALAVGLGAGSLTGGLTAAGVALVHAFPEGAVRGIFIQVSPQLLAILTFGRGLPVAAAVLCLGGAALGGLGAGFRLLPRAPRRALGVGLSVTFLFALLQTFIPPMLVGLGLETSWLYSLSFGGLTRLGAVLVFAVSTAAAWGWTVRGPALRRRVAEMPAEGRRGLGLLGLAAVFLVLVFLPHLVGSALSEILGDVGIYLLMGLGLNIVVGYAGLLDLGYVAFFAVGAYVTSLFTAAHLVTSLGETVDPKFVLHLGFYEALPLVIMVAALTGVLIGAPVLRLRGDYLAIVTLGFGEIARVLVTSDWLKDFVGGAQGLRDVTDAPILGVSFRNPQNFYFLVLALCLLAIYVSRRLADSRVGRAWNAMREDEQVAEAMGISTIKYKLLAFAMGASIGCLSGALFAVKIGSLTPVSFNILVSITALAVIILGGMGSIPGVVLGALVLIGVPGLLAEFEDYRLLMYGFVLIAIMILRPQGLIPNVRRMRELREEEVAQDAWLRRAGEASVEPGVAVGAGEGPAS